MYNNIICATVYDDLLHHLGAANDVLKTLVKRSHQPVWTQSRPPATVQETMDWLRKCQSHAATLRKSIIATLTNCDCGNRLEIYLRPPNLLAARRQNVRLPLIVSQPNKFDNIIVRVWDVVEIAEIQTVIDARSITRIYVQEDLTRPEPDDDTSPFKLIHHLCPVFSSSNTFSDGQLVGYFDGLHTGPHFQVKASIRADGELASISLLDIVGRITRRDRIRIAAMLASAVVVYHGTWLKPVWGLSDVKLSSNPTPDREQGPGIEGL